MTLFRLGLVGAGRRGRVHLRALFSSGTVRAVAVAEPSETACVGLGDLAIHADVAAMLRRAVWTVFLSRHRVLCISTW